MTNLITCVIKQLFNTGGWKQLYEQYQSDKNVSVVYSNCNLQFIPHTKNSLYKKGKTIYKKNQYIPQYMAQTEPT